MISGTRITSMAAVFFSAVCCISPCLVIAQSCCCHGVPKKNKKKAAALRFSLLALIRHPVTEGANEANRMGKKEEEKELQQPVLSAASKWKNVAPPA